MKHICEIIEGYIFCEHDTKEISLCFYKESTLVKESVDFCPMCGFCFLYMNSPSEGYPIQTVTCYICNKVEELADCVTIYPWMCYSIHPDVNYSPSSMDNPYVKMICEDCKIDFKKKMHEFAISIIQPMQELNEVDIS